jgi:hypothetical protein
MIRNGAFQVAEGILDGADVILRKGPAIRSGIGQQFMPLIKTWAICRVRAAENPKRPLASRCREVRS